MPTCTLSVKKGEAIFSLLLRYCRWTSTDIEHLAGKMVIHQKTIFRDLPIGVRVYENYTGSRFKFRPALLTEHSAAMYFLSAVPAAFREEQLRFCTERSTILDRISVATTWSHLRFCPKCAADEFKTHRYSWWHRDHQLPLSVVCIEHRCLLIPAPLEYRSKALPHEYARPACVEIVDSSAVEDDLFAICRFEQFLATSTSNALLDRHVYQHLQLCLSYCGQHHEVEEQLLAITKRVLVGLKQVGEEEPAMDWDRIRLRIIALIRNGTDHCDPVAAVLVAIASRRLYGLTG